MTRLAVVSMKGGVGKTSCTANLAAALAAAGQTERDPAETVSVIDLDPQNALRLHLGIPPNVTQGLAGASDAPGDWREVVLKTRYGVRCLPYGCVSEDERRQFETWLGERPGRLAEALDASGLGMAGDLLLLDTPPGPTIYLREAFACADAVLLVLLSDPGSYATVPAMEAWVGDWQAQKPELRTLYLINQSDSSIPLYHDIAEVLRHHLGERVAGVTIHRDEAVSEALAFQKPVIVYDPHGQASHDFIRLAKLVREWLD